MRRKVFMPDEVIRFLTYGFLLALWSNTPLANAQFDVTPFSYNDDDIKEPNFSNSELNADYNDLQSIYDDTAHMLYNSTGDGNHPNIHQVYPSQNQQNYTDWFANLLNNTNGANFPIMYNFSKLFPGVNTSKDSYYKLPDTFRVYPSDKNFTILNLKIPPNVSNVDANIFQNAFNSSPSNDNDKEIYINMPPINSMSLNETENSNFLDQFFHTNTTPHTIAMPVSSGYSTSAPSAQTTTSSMPPTAVLPKPTPNPMNITNPMNFTMNTPSSMVLPQPNISNTTATVNDFLAKRIAQDETINATIYIDNMLDKLGLQRITLDGNPKEPMYVYKMNTTDISAGNLSQSQNYTLPKKNFYFVGNETNRPPLIFPPAPFHPIQQNHTIITPLPFPVMNSTQNFTFPGGPLSNISVPWGNTTKIPIPYVGQQGNLTYYGEPGDIGANETDSGTPQTSTIPKNISFSAAVNDSVSDQYGEIVYTSVYFISGSSTPPQPYPNDPYGNVSYWPEGINELTNDGKKELYKLGRWLHDRYNPLIGRQFNSSSVSIDSGASDIALTSAESLAAGLFPPRGQEIWNPLMLWQPIPVRSIPTTDDNVILMSKYCKQYDLQTKDLNTSPYWLQFYENNTETMNYISENTGSNFTKNNLLDALQKIFYYYEDLRIEEGGNFALPNWTSTVYPDKMMYLAQQYIEYAITTRDLQKIKTGPFFKTIIDNMSTKINSANTSSEFSERMHLYSGDVFGIGFIMKTLGISNSIIPPDASALIFDLRYKENEFVVTVSYKNSSSDVLYVLTIPHCGPICKFSQFINITNDLMLENWDSYCETISIFDLTYTIPIVIFGLAIIFILAIVVVLLVIKCCKNIQKKRASFG